MQVILLSQSRPVQVVFSSGQYLKEIRTESLEGILPARPLLHILIPSGEKRATPEERLITYYRLAR